MIFPLRPAVAAGVLDQTPEDWDKVIETNLNSCFLLSKFAAQSMVKRHEGKIINIASLYAFFGSGFIPSYSGVGVGC
jgi:2-dehydro-3-deoxy-D-gluconate 5-dehydrogenase